MEKFISAYGTKLRNVVIKCNDNSLTKQSSKNECNINFIMDKYRKTGIPPEAKSIAARYAEYPEIDFHEAMNIVAEGNNMFNRLPAHIRTEFDNDPIKFIEALQDPRNKDDLIALGVLIKSPENDAGAVPASVSGDSPPAGQQASPEPPKTAS